MKIYEVENPPKTTWRPDAEIQAERLRTLLDDDLLSSLLDMPLRDVLQEGSSNRVRNLCFDEDCCLSIDDSGGEDLFYRPPAEVIFLILDWQANQLQKINKKRQGDNARSKVREVE